MLEDILDIAHEWLDEQAEQANYFILTELTDTGIIQPVSLE